jgi:putative membrane protein
VLSEAEQTRVGDAIRAAERRTSAEILCVLMRASSAYSSVPPLWGALVALVSPWPMVVLTSWSVLRILELQIAIFIAATLLFSWRPLRLMLVPKAIRRIRAQRAAMEQFHARGLTRTHSRRGLMIFVSVAERAVHVVADEGIATVIADASWQPVVDALAGAIAKGHIVEGFEAAVGACAEILASHFPAGEGGGELPDKIYVL